MSAFTIYHYTGGAPSRANQSYIGPGWGQNIDNLQEPSYRMTEPYTDIGALQETDILWARSNFPAMFSSGSQTNPENPMSQRWEWNWPPTGCHVPKKVSGVVVNASGTPVSGVTVDLFNTATALLVDTQITAADGSFTCGDPNAVACFAVADIAGTPETAGTTIQSLTGT